MDRTFQTFGYVADYEENTKADTRSTAKEARDSANYVNQKRIYKLK
jgi:hypothetical protein